MLDWGLVASPGSTKPQAKGSPRLGIKIITGLKVSICLRTSKPNKTCTGEHTDDPETYAKVLNVTKHPRDAN